MIPVATVEIGEKEKEYVNDCLATGWVSSLGKYVTAFEEAFDYTRQLGRVDDIFARAGL